MGESKIGGRTATSVRSPASNDSPGLTHRMRSSGSSIARCVRSTVNQLVTSVAFGQASRTAGEVADVVVIVVGQEDPADVGRVDDRERGAPSTPCGDSSLPVSTITGSAPVMTIELSET